MGRLLALVMALLGAALVSQGPEFSQQYMQRLGGALGELRAFVEGFDRNARTAGLSREDALAAYGRAAEGADGDFLSLQGVQASDMIARYEMLDAHMVELRRADEYGRTILIARRHDLPLLEATLADYRPAMPLTVAGVVHAGIGFFLGWVTGLLVAGLLALLFAPFFRPRRV